MGESLPASQDSSILLQLLGRRCAELLRFPKDKRVDDRIDEG